MSPFTNPTLTELLSTANESGPLQSEAASSQCSLPCGVSRFPSLLTNLLSCTLVEGFASALQPTLE